MTNLLGWIPLPPGIWLRNILYATVFRQIGKSVKIQPGVEFTDAGCIEIGNEVTMNSGVYLDARQNSRITLGERVYLDRDVRISCTSGHGEVVIRTQVRLDRGVDIKVHGEGFSEIGSRTYIGPYTCLSGYGDIRIGEDCLIASHSTIYAHNYNFADPTRKIGDQGYEYKGIVIEDNCWLGAGVRVLDGVTLGKGSVIGAGAVVTKDIPPYSVAVGVPAKVISKRTSSDKDSTNKYLESILAANKQH